MIFIPKAIAWQFIMHDISSGLINILYCVCLQIAIVIYSFIYWLKYVWRLSGLVTWKYDCWYSKHDDYILRLYIYIGVYWYYVCNKQEKLIFLYLCYIVSNNEIEIKRLIVIIVIIKRIYNVYPTSHCWAGVSKESVLRRNLPRWFQSSKDSVTLLQHAGFITVFFYH